MQTNSLCPVHRKWLALHPEQALSYLDELQSTANQLRQHRSPTEALPYLFCAYEVSVLLLERQIEQYPQVVIQFTGNAISLADTLNKAHTKLSSSDLLTEAYLKLETCSADMEITPFVPQYVEQCLNALKNGAAFFGRVAEKMSIHPAATVH